MLPGGILTPVQKKLFSSQGHSRRIPQRKMQPIKLPICYIRLYNCLLHYIKKENVGVHLEMVTKVISRLLRFVEA